MQTIPSYSRFQIAALVCFSACAITFSQAATFSLNPSLDSFVTPGSSGSLSGNNYGGAGALSVAAPGLSQGEFQSDLQFNLAAARSSFDATFGVGQWSVQSITLQLTAAAPNNGIFNASSAGQFSISLMQNNGWTEGTGNPSAPTTTGITFNTLSNFVSGADESNGTFSFGGGTSGVSTFTLSLSPGLENDTLSGGLASLRLFAADNAVSYLFDSRSFGTSSARPLLTITAVPEPDAVALDAMGLGFLFRRRFAGLIKQG